MDQASTEIRLACALFELRLATDALRDAIWV
jgi:hypothetical protein